MLCRTANELYWMGRHIERADGILLGLNVLLLMDVAFLPFSTNVLALSLRGTSAEHTAAAFYGLVLAVGGVLLACDDCKVAFVRACIGSQQ